MQYHKNKFKNLKHGLTLVESLVAITILIVGVIGPLSIAAQGIGDGIFAQNQITANYLAQEGLELVVNKRYALARKYQYTTRPAGNFFNQDENLKSCLSAGSGSGLICSINAINNSMQVSQVFQNCTNCDLVFNKTVGLYVDPVNNSDPTQNAGPIFRREVVLESADPDKMKVTVTVRWNNKDTPKSLTLVEELFSKG